MSENYRSVRCVSRAEIWTRQIPD